MKANTRLRREREQRGWSQSKVAQAVGTTAKNVSRWEHGVTLPQPYFREKLCLLFNRNAEELDLLSSHAQVDEEVPSPSQTPREPETASSFREKVQDPTRPLLTMDLVGREELLSLLRQRLCHNERTAMPVRLALYGLPGVGKTALAATLLQMAEVQKHFCDGMLWIGAGPHPDVAGQLSRWGTLLGISATEKARLSNREDWGKALRAAIGMRRMLILIDDAWELEDALAFKVGGPNCAHLMTTRFPQVALSFADEGAVRVPELQEADGIRLLASFVPDIVAKEQEMSSLLVRSVGGLSLALTLMGKYLRAQAQSGQPRRIEAAIERLQVVEVRLHLIEPYAPVERPSALPAGTSLSLQSVIAVSDRQLNEQARCALRSLSIFPAKPNSFSEEAALVVCALPVETLDALTDAGLLESCGAGRYTLHQTIADYARSNLDTAEETLVYKRMVEYALHYVEAHEMDYPLLERESSTILTALDVAFERGMHAELIRVVNAFASFLSARIFIAPATMHLQRAYQAALSLGDLTGRMIILSHLGCVAKLQGNYVQGTLYFQEGLTLARQLVDNRCIGRFLKGLGGVAIEQGEYDQAARYLQEGLAVARRYEDRECVSGILTDLSKMALHTGEYTEAEAYIQEGLAVARQLTHQEQMSALLRSLGIVAEKRGELLQAAAYYEEGLSLARQIDNRELICHLLIQLGVLAVRRSDYAQAEAYLHDGLSMARQLDFQSPVPLALGNLGWIAAEQGEYHNANLSYQEALFSARRQRNRWVLCVLLNDWGEIHLKNQQVAAAAVAFEEALAVVPAGQQEQEAYARYGLARVAAAQGNRFEARFQAEASLAIFEMMGHYKVQTIRHWLSIFTCESSSR